MQNIQPKPQTSQEATLENDDEDDIIIIEEDSAVCGQPISVFDNESKVKVPPSLMNSTQIVHKKVIISF